MSRILLVAMAALMLTGCGVRRPLIAPQDVPAHEQRRQEKLKERQIQPEAQAPMRTHT